MRRVAGAGDLRLYDVRALVNVSRLRADFFRMRPDTEYCNRYLVHENREHRERKYEAVKEDGDEGRLAWTHLEPATFVRSLDVFIEATATATDRREREQGEDRKRAVSVSATASRRTPRGWGSDRRAMIGKDLNVGVMCVARDQDDAGEHAAGAMLCVTNESQGESTSVELPPGYMAVFGLEEDDKVDFTIGRVKSGLVDMYVFTRSLEFEMLT